MDKIPTASWAFTDGSYNKQLKRYGWGGFIVTPLGEKIIIQGSDNNPDFVAMQSVAGEIYGSMSVINKAIEMGIPKITIYYDNFGIEYWATGRWKRNKIGTKLYHNFFKTSSKLISIEFKKVKGHSGIDGNEEADLLARQAVGLERL